MKLREWIEFNFKNKQISTNVGDIYVKVFRKESYKTDDKILENNMRIDDALALFGDYKLFYMSMYTETANGLVRSCVSVSIYQEV